MSLCISEVTEDSLLRMIRYYVNSKIKFGNDYKDGPRKSTNL